MVCGLEDMGVLCMNVPSIVKRTRKRVESNLARNEPTRTKVVLEKKNRCLEYNKYTQTNTPTLVRFNAHEVVRAAKHI